MHLSQRYYAALCVLAGWFLLASTPTGAEPTDLDLSFGEQGIVRLPGAFWIPGSAAAYPDGRLVLLLAGSVVRLDSAGHLDTSFARVISSPPLAIDAIAVSSSGHLITLRNILQAPTGETRLTRHLDDGSLDPTFGEGGNLLVSRFMYGSGLARIPPAGEFTNGLAVDPAGAVFISIAGFAWNGETWITSVGPRGSPVEQWNRSKGRAQPLGPMHAPGERKVTALLRDYRQLVYGGPEVGGPAVMRLVDGVPDPTFGSEGIAFHPIPGWWITNIGQGTYDDFASTPDGGYVVVGVVHESLQPPHQSQVTVVRFTATGQLDRSFGTSGVAKLKLIDPADSRATSLRIAVQADGRIVVASTIEHSAEGSFVARRVGLGRLTTAGQPDAQFAPAGVTSFWIDHGTAVGSVFIRPDGRIVLVGEIVAPPGGASAVFQFQGGDSKQARSLEKRLAVEYFYAEYGHYFVTADPHEIMSLDAYSPNGWKRTGYSFSVWNDEDATLTPACRFWSDRSFAPKSSHLYTPYAAECAALKEGTTWTFERNAFQLRMPEGTTGRRVCPANSRPLYRAYNNGQGGAPNHRYTIDPTLLDHMIEQGWTMEGEVGTRVFACVPPTQSRSLLGSWSDRPSPAHS